MKESPLGRSITHNTKTHKEYMNLNQTYLTKEIEVRLNNKLGNKNTSGWSSIPNVRKFLITPGEKDPRWESVGIQKNTPPSIYVTPLYNKKMNRYIKYQVSRLIRHRNNPSVFWKIAVWLLKNSIAFRVSAINKVLKGWYKNLPFWTVFNINRKVDEILRKEKDDLIFKRVYIPKGKTYRPLGVPTKEWRIVLHMYSNMLGIFLKPKLLDSQHGFIPGRGTLTAWKDLVTNVLPADFIYECDLKQFFPTVKSNEISNALEGFGVPKRWIYFFENINLCQPELAETDLLDESQVRLTIQDREDIKSGVFRWESRMYNPLRELIRENGPGILHELYPGKHPFEIVQEQWALAGQYSHSSVEGSHVGTPQGAPTSPILAISTLIPFLTQTPSISYADDPIFYSNKDFKIKDDPSKGIVLNQEKSNWVKREGKWLKDLKYLGLIYRHETGNIEAATRKGSTLIMTEDYANIINGKFDTSDVIHPYKSWVKLLSSKIAGIIQSRMYLGSWNPEELDKDLELIMGDHSWISKVHKNDYTTIYNASSYACHSLAHILSGYVRRKTKKSIITKTMTFKSRIA